LLTVNARTFTGLPPSYITRATKTSRSLKSIHESISWDS